MVVRGSGAVLRRLETTFTGRCVTAFLEQRGVDRAMAVSAQSFTALIPLLLLASLLAPGDDGSLVADGVIERFRLSGAAAEDVRQVFAVAGDAGTGALSVVLLVFSGVSLARRLQRLYEQAWRLPARAGLRASVDALLGIAALVLTILLLSFLHGVAAPGAVPRVLGWTGHVLAGCLLWAAIPWLLLGGRLPWRRLLPTGVLAAVCSAAYALATAVYMPLLMESYSRRYGLFGVTLALVGWLLCVAVIIVVTTIVGAELDRAPEPWARRLRAALGPATDPAGGPGPGRPASSSEEDAARARPGV
ncbi:YhjD/YihY/BrkB family envelope integrity protein [Geodermatophilus sp. SYSU D00700]